MSTLPSFLSLAKVFFPLWCIIYIYIQRKYFLVFLRDNVKSSQNLEPHGMHPAPCFPVPSYQQTQPSSFSSVLPQNPPP